MGVIMRLLLIQFSSMTEILHGAELMCVGPILAKGPDDVEAACDFIGDTWIMSDAMVPPWFAK